MMNRVEILAEEIRHLTRDELARFREWFVRFDSEAWDRQIESDAQAGRPGEAAERALAAHQRGESTPL